MLLFSDAWIFFGCLLSGVLLDRILGEPARWHPLVGFGALATRLERMLNRSPSSRFARPKGAAAWAALVVPGVVVAYLMGGHDFGFVAHALLLAIALGARSLRDHVRPIARALRNGDLPAARSSAQRIVSRDLSRADRASVARAAVESTLENGGDAIFSTLFWFAVAGGPGVVLHRLANTLDAMWGYKTPRWSRFGWAAARLDDVLNYLPARLTALSYLALGDRSNAWHCWRKQAPAWASPNAGPVMTAGAGALGLRLGGGAWYHGVWEERPPLGRGRVPEAGDIDRALRLLDRAVCLWLCLALILTVGGVYARAWW